MVKTTAMESTNGPEDLSALEEAIGYQFDNRQLLERAMTHRSYANEHRSVTEDNQRLEFLGDAVLGVVISGALFLADDEAPEGTLSSRLSELVCEGTLVDRAKALNLGQFLQLGRGEELTGGRHKDGLLADAYEALLGALFLDGGYEPVHRVIVEQFEVLIAGVSTGRECQQLEAPGDFKSLFQRQVQSERPVRPEYQIVETSGPPHQRRFVAQVSVEGTEVGRGEGASKKEAEQAAASKAVAALDACEGRLDLLLESRSEQADSEQADEVDETT